MGVACTSKDGLRCQHGNNQALRKDLVASEQRDDELLDGKVELGDGDERDDVDQDIDRAFGHIVSLLLRREDFAGQFGADLADGAFVDISGEHAQEDTVDGLKRVSPHLVAGLDGAEEVVQDGVDVFLEEGGPSQRDQGSFEDLRDSGRLGSLLEDQDLLI